MECTVYQGSVSSGSPGGDKGTAKAPKLRVRGYLVCFFYFNSGVLCTQEFLHSAGVFFSVVYRPQSLFIYYFSSII